jgi:DNA-binding transcriptional ArsR family regulator
MSSTAVYGRISEIFKALSDPTRLRILYCLSRGERSVGEIVDEVAMTQSAVSHQLRLLKDKRLVRVRREGKFAYYTLDDDHVANLLAIGFDHASHE